jgi:hypothetical protein
LVNLPSVILWTWPYHVSFFCSVSFIIVSSNPICCLIVTFLILSILFYPEYTRKFCKSTPYLQLREDPVHNSDLVHRSFF